MVYSFDFPVRVKLHNVALFGEKDCIDTLHNQSFLLRIIKDVSFSCLSINKEERYALISLTRYKESEPRFVIILPYEYQNEFIDYLSSCSEKNSDKFFDFHYPDPILMGALPAIDISVEAKDSNDIDNLQKIRKALKFPLQLPNVSDDTENTPCLYQDSTSSNNPHTSHICICFHS